jgi:membrane-associated protein
MFDVEALLQSGGLLILALIIFAETGLLLGFFLPGDTLLIAAGLLASEQKLPILLVPPIAFGAAIAGYHVGYLIGERVGPRLFKRHDGILFREDYINRTSLFLNKHGGKALILARFVPVVRTLIPLIAGIGKMSKKRFNFYNIVGGLVWTFGLTLAAYWIGTRVPDLDRFIAPLILLATVLTFGSAFWKFASNADKRRALKHALREEYNYFFGRKKD